MAAARAWALHDSVSARDRQQSWFGRSTRPGRTGRAIIGDARYEIRHLTERYDLIIHDCFTGGSEPAHLLTVETLAQLRGLLTEHGILALNFVAFSQRHQAALASVARTLQQVLPRQQVFVSDPGRDFRSDRRG